MQSRLNVLIIVVSLLVFIAVLELIRRGRLREEYSLIWLFSAGMIFVMAVSRGSLLFVADLIQIEYAPSFIFAVFIGLLMIIVLFQSVAISKLTSQSRDLAQKLGILEMQLRQISSNLSDKNGDYPDTDIKNLLKTTEVDIEEYEENDQLLKRALKLAKVHTRASGGALLINEPDDGQIKNLVVSDDLVVEDGVEVEPEIFDKGLTSWVMKNRRPVILSDTPEDTRWIEECGNQSLPGYKSAICVPVKFNEHTIGIVTMVHQNKNRFGPRDLNFIEALFTNVSDLLSDSASV